MTSIKKRVSSMSFSLNRLYERISTAKPSTSLLGALAIGFAIFLFAGGIYDLSLRPYPAVYYNKGFLFLYPRLSEQFITDSIISGTLYFLGILGLLTIYQSTKYAYKPRQAIMTLLVGLAFVILAWVLLEAVIVTKLSGVS
jgi:hypothetical protein